MTHPTTDLTDHPHGWSVLSPFDHVVIARSAAWLGERSSLHDDSPRSAEREHCGVWELGFRVGQIWVLSNVELQALLDSADAEDS